MAHQLLNLPRPPPLTTAPLNCSSLRFGTATPNQHVHHSWASLHRSLNCNPRFTCLFSHNNRKQEQAKKALESALGGKKTEFEKWDKEIQKRTEAGGGGDAGGGGWFRWGRWFGGSNGDHFWQEAQQTSLAVLGIILMDDESLRKWKEQLLGSVDINSIGETLEPDVKILSLAIKSPGRPDIFLPVPESGNPKGLWFSLKEGSRYSLKFTFQVNNNIVLGLKYKNTVWKTGVKVDSTKEMLGTFSPQLEPYMHEMPEETTPSGFFARGTYSVRTKFVDDDKKCYLEINYSFDIRKEWK